MKRRSGLARLAFFPEKQLAVQRREVFWLHAHIRAVWHEHVGLGVILQHRSQDVHDPLLQITLHHGKQNLDAGDHIASHPVRAGQVHFWIAAIAKGVNATMLQISADDARDPDVFADAGNAWTQAANAADDQIDFHPGARGAVQRFDDFLVGQSIHLGGDVSRLVRQAILNFAFDQIEERFAQSDGSSGDFLPFWRVGIAGQMVEKVGGICPDLFTRSKHAHVRVHACGFVVVIARAKVHISAQAIALGADDQRDFAVSL